VVQQGNLRITVLSQILPYKLPTTGTAPIAVFVGGHIATPSGETPPQLQQMSVKVNRHGLLQSKGLPTCTLAQLQPGSSERALSNCSDALVGSGRFWATIVLPDRRPYFNSSFVITFAIEKISQGPYGTEPSASLPQALGDWGFVDRSRRRALASLRGQGREGERGGAHAPRPGTCRRQSADGQRRRGNAGARSGDRGGLQRGLCQAAGEVERLCGGGSAGERFVHGPGALEG
jgi:hypothetical protein